MSCYKHEKTTKNHGTKHKSNKEQRYSRCGKTRYTQTAKTLPFNKLQHHHPHHTKVTGNGNV